LGRNKVVKYKIHGKIYNLTRYNIHGIKYKIFFNKEMPINLRLYFHPCILYLANMVQTNKNFDILYILQYT